MGTQPTEIQPAQSVQWLIESLAAMHGVDLCQTGISLTLTRPERSDQILLYNAGADHVILAYLTQHEDGQALPEVEFLFFTSATDWQVVEIRYAPAAWRANNSEVTFNDFVAHWTNHLVQQGWLTAGQACVRISGCQSISHTTCYGELWRCTACHRTFCCAEGTDNHPELCDDCWAARFAPEWGADTPRVTFTAEGTLELPCPCPEQCGAWLELTADGVLALEDKDGLRVSILLPVWLEEVIRQAVAVQQAAIPKAHHKVLND